MRLFDEDVKATRQCKNEYEKDGVDDEIGFFLTGIGILPCVICRFIANFVKRR